MSQFLQLIENKLDIYCKLIRWDKPIGTFLLLWPTLTALVIAAKGKPDPLILFVFFTGVFITRAAGCIINDLVDMKFDKYVNRTQNRPLPSEQMNKWEAVILCGILLMLAFLLVRLLNNYSFFLAIIGLIFTLIYPFLKRIINLPQLGLGITFNWGIPMAFAAQNNHIPLIGWLLFTTAVLWTVSYDTMYAMTDRADDLKIGIKSTAIFFGENDRFAIAVLQVMITTMLLTLGLSLQLKHWFYVGLIISTCLFLYQQYLIANRDPGKCQQAFLNNHWAWFFIFFAIYLSYGSH